MSATRAKSVVTQTDQKRHPGPARPRRQSKVIMQILLLQFQFDCPSQWGAVLPFSICVSTPNCGRRKAPHVGVGSQVFCVIVVAGWVAGGVSRILSDNTRTFVRPIFLLDTQTRLCYIHAAILFISYVGNSFLTFGVS